jgi:predicted nucleic-acid-binding protein
MIGLEPNILARHLLKDDEAQFERVRAIVEATGR